MSSTLMGLACLFGMCGPANGNFDNLPLQQAIVYQNGTGAQKVAVFADIDCAPCRKNHMEMARLKDTTVYVFLYPLLSDGKPQMAYSTWCASDQRKALDDAMAGVQLAPVNCKDPTVDRNLELGRKIGIRSVPALMAPNGKILYGGRPFDEFSSWIGANQVPGSTAIPNQAAAN